MEVPLVHMQLLDWATGGPGRTRSPATEGLLRPTVHSLQVRPRYAPCGLRSGRSKSLSAR